MKTAVILLCAVATQAAAADWPAVTVQAEEPVYTYLPPNNGSGPLWCYGATPIARLGDDVYVSQFETGEEIPPLCNTRWRLLRRDGGAWTTVDLAGAFRQREPCPLAVTGPNTLFLYVNDSQTAPGTHYLECKPYLRQYVINSGSFDAESLEPIWDTEPRFTDHSYRGFGADRTSRRAIMMNIDADTSIQHWAVIDEAGQTVSNGQVSFPIRACYPQVALHGNAAHVLAIGDIREPVDEWQQYKFEQTGQRWDYVFRILYYSHTPDIDSQPMHDPIEIANRDATAGAISNQDLWIAPDGRAYIVYREQEVASALMRDKFFPGKSIVPSLHLAVVEKGEVVERHTLIQGTETRQPGNARFHEAADGRLYALVNTTGEGAGNALMPIYPDVRPDVLLDIPLEKPFGAFSLATVRAGNAPSDTIDILGHTDSGTRLDYAQVTLE